MAIDQVGYTVGDGLTADLRLVAAGEASEALSTKSAGKEHGTFLITYIDVLYGIMKAKTVIPPRHEQTMASPDSRV